jgi:hypothetical protein
LVLALLHLGLDDYSEALLMLVAFGRPDEYGEETVVEVLVVEEGLRLGRGTFLVIIVDPRGL